MPIKKDTYTSLLFLLLYAVTFCNLFMLQHFNGDAYPQNQYPNAKTKPGIADAMEGKSSGKSDGNSNAKWLYYTDSMENYATIYPKEWEIVKGKSSGNSDNSNQTGSVTIFRSPKESQSDAFQDNIVISALKPAKNSTGNNNFEIQTIVKKLAMSNMNFELENVSTVYVGGDHMGESITYSFERSGMDFKTEQVFSSISNKIYVLSLLAERQSFDDYYPTLKLMVNNFTLKNNGT